MNSRNRHGPAFLRGVGLTALALALVLAAVPPAEAGAPHLREGVTFGVGVGVSKGRIDVYQGGEGQTVQSGWEKGVTPQFRVGYAVVKNHLLLTLGNQQWLYEQGVLADDKLRINAQNWSLVATWCPFNPHSATGGIYVNAGIGYANTRLTILEPIEEDEHGNTFEEIFKSDEFGTAYQVGLGYEFRLTKLFAAGLSASYIYQDTGGEIFDHTEVVPLNLTLNWYW